MKPSQSKGVVHIFFVINRDSSVVETKPVSDLYVLTAWITLIVYVSVVLRGDLGKSRLTVRMNKVGRTGSSRICCMTTARISERKTSVIEKQIPMAAGEVSTESGTRISRH